MGSHAIIDLNCDVGESETSDGMRHEHAILPFVSSINVACGGHAGTPETMQHIVRASREHNLFVGAHPGFEDRLGFGRSPIDLPVEQIIELVSRQCRALQAVCAANGVKLHHVKPHGALYNMAEEDRSIADSVAYAIRSLDPNLIVYALADGVLMSSCFAHDLAVWGEAFPDRGYNWAGKLIPRNQPDAVIAERDTIISRALEMLLNQLVVTERGPLKCERINTVCFHSDHPEAAYCVQSVQSSLEKLGLKLANAI